MLKFSVDPGPLPPMCSEWKLHLKRNANQLPNETIGKDHTFEAEPGERVRVQCTAYFINEEDGQLHAERSTFPVTFVASEDASPEAGPNTPTVKLVTASTPNLAPKTSTDIPSPKPTT